MKKFSDKRKIKIFGDIIEKGETGILPFSLQSIKSDKSNIYATQFFINNPHNMMLDYAFPNNKQLVKSNRNKSEIMEIPDLSLPLTDILNIYGINTYEELLKLIEKLLFNNDSEYTIFRLVNIFTRVYYDELKNNFSINSLKKNNSLIKIFKIIFNNEATNHTELSVFKIDDNKLSSFLKQWFEKNDKDSFYLNICKDVKNFLSNKYESI